MDVAEETLVIYQLLGLEESHNLSDCKSDPEMSKDIQFSKHLLKILREPGTVPSWHWAFGDD